VGEGDARIMLGVREDDYLKEGNRMRGMRILE